MLRSLKGTSDEKMIIYRARIQSIVDQQHRSNQERCRDFIDLVGTTELLPERWNEGKIEVIAC